MNKEIFMVGTMIFGLGLFLGAYFILPPNEAIAINDCQKDLSRSQECVLIAIPMPEKAEKRD